MGMLKKIIGRTSRKLLATIIPNCQSHQLILNQPAQPGDITDAMHKSAKHRASRLHKKMKKSNAKDTAVAQALLLAAKNYLPPVQFHHVHGPNAQLSANRSVARRTQGFCQALVFSNRVILPNERVYIKITEIAKGWSGTIRFGFTAVDPATLAYRMPKHACPDMTNAGHTWARALADEVVRRNSVIHFSYNKDGLIHYGINNQDCGIFHANVSTNQNLWFIVDVYGLTAAVELIDPRVNNAGSDSIDDRSTMYKSTSVMEDIFGDRTAQTSGGCSRSRRKQSRKAARQAAAAAGIIHGNWPLEHQLMINSSALRLPLNYQQQQQQQLPNLNSTALPTAEQNIYTPMPVALPRPPVPAQAAQIRSRSQQRIREDPHDYHQIYSTNDMNHSNRSHAKLNAAASIANLPLAHMNSSFVSQASSSCTTDSTDSAEISQNLYRRFQSIDLNNGKLVSSGQSPKIQSSNRSPLKSSSNSQNTTPVAAARRRQIGSTERTSASKRSPDTNLREQTRAFNHRVGSSTSKQAHTSSAASSSAILSPSASSSAQIVTNSSTTAAKQTNSARDSVKPRTRHSIKHQKKPTTSTTLATTTRDNNNNSPPSKDCPICFERPINCVLYQCGHMCTCYECGVKQWKTQSRTCPICRTIIKDVIKTYMS